MYKHVGPARTVTLATGDTVRISPDGWSTITPGPGREDMGFTRLSLNGDTYVIPRDAVSADSVAARDRSPFNVSALIRQAYAVALAAGSPVGADPDAAQRELMVHFQGRGTVGWATGIALNLDTGATVLLWLECGADTVRVTVEPGRWEILGAFGTEGETGVFSTDVTVVDEDADIVWDIRDAAPVAVELRDRPDARLDRLDAGIRVFPTEHGLPGASVEASIPPSDRLYVKGTAPLKGRRYTFTLRHSYTSPAGVADPYRYELFRLFPDALPDGVAMSYGDADLYRVRHVNESRGVDLSGQRTDRAKLPGSAIAHEEPVPGATTTFYSPNTWWSHLETGFGYGDTQFTRFVAAAGVDRGTLRWNRAPLGVGANAATGRGLWLFPGAAWISASLFAGPDPDINTTHAYPSRGHTELAVNGTLVASVEGSPCDQFLSLPEDLSGRLTIRCDVERDLERMPWTRLGTRSSAAWDIAAASVEVPTRMDLSSVRLNASGVRDGFAPRRLPQRIELTVDHTFTNNPGTASLTFEVSYDDGATWTSVPLTRNGDRAVAVLSHPKDASWVSVRTAATDGAGNSVRQTTVRSYGLNS